MMLPAARLQTETLKTPAFFVPWYSQSASMGLTLECAPIPSFFDQVSVRGKKNKTSEWLCLQTLTPWNEVLEPLIRAFFKKKMKLAETEKSF